MGRPPQPLATAGRVRTYKTEIGWTARTRFRDLDGKIRDVQRNGRSEGAARSALSQALRDRVRHAGIGLTPDSLIAELAEMWFAQILTENKSPSTLELYRSRIDLQIIPRMGSLRLRELSVGIAHRHLMAIKARHGPALARTCKSVLSGMCALAARHDAMPTNPIRDVGRISVKTKKLPTALKPAEVVQLIAFLSYDPVALRHDIGQIVAILFATGARIGEICGLEWDAVDLDAGTIELRQTVLRLKAQGLIIKRETKTEAGNRILELPSWAIQLLRRRKAESQTTLVFPSPEGHLRDPSNTRRTMQQAFARAGYSGLNSHTFRKSLSSLMLKARLDPASVADQLGHNDASTTLRSYAERKVRHTGAVDLIELLFSDGSESGHN